MSADLGEDVLLGLLHPVFTEYSLTRRKHGIQTVIRLDLRDRSQRDVTGLAAYGACSLGDARQDIFAALGDLVFNGVHGFRSMCHERR